MSMSNIYGKYYNSKEHFSEEKCLNHQRIQNKIQCFASKFALNNTIEDMNEVQKKGCFAFELVYYSPNFTEESDHSFDLWICKKEDKRNIHRKDYSFACPHSHIFFEIPIVRAFTPEQIIKWQLWAYEECKRLISLNMKKRDSWLKKKKMMEDFSVEEEKKPNDSNPLILKTAPF